MDNAPRTAEELLRNLLRRVTWLERYKAAGDISTSEADATGLATGLSGTIHAVRQGRLVALYGNLGGLPSAALPTVIFTLPVGYRPITTTKHVIGGSLNNNTGERLISVETNGNVRLLSVTTGTGLWLNGVTFVGA